MTGVDESVGEQRHHDLDAPITGWRNGEPHRCDDRDAHHPDSEAQRNDEQYSFVSAWEYQGPDKPPLLNKEPLVYDEVHMSTRSYK